jgi:hypothetical protein
MVDPEAKNIPSPWQKSTTSRRSNVRLLETVKSMRTRLRTGGYSHGLGRLTGSINDGEVLPGGKSQFVAIDAYGDPGTSVALMDVDPHVAGDDGIRCRVGTTPWAEESEGLDSEAGEGVGGGESGRIGDGAE